MSDIKIAVIGLGYVGLPLARLFATKYSVVGFDINTERIAELRSGTDSTLEVEKDVLKAVLKIRRRMTRDCTVPAIWTISKTVTIMWLPCQPLLIVPIDQS